MDVFAGLQLLEHQSKKEDESCLPRLRLEDVAPTIEMTKLNHLNMGEWGSFS